MTRNQFEELRIKLTRFVAIEGYKRLKNKIYATCLSVCGEEVRMKAVLYAYTFNTYEMNYDGSTTGKYNYITQEEFEDIAKEAERICSELSGE